MKHKVNVVSRRYTFTMSDLVPTPIVDKNGIATIRNKKPEQTSASSARVSGVTSPPVIVGVDHSEETQRFIMHTAGRKYRDKVTGDIIEFSNVISTGYYDENGVEFIAVTMTNISTGESKEITFDTKGMDDWGSTSRFQKLIEEVGYLREPIKASDYEVVSRYVGHLFDSDEVAGLYTWSENPDDKTLKGLWASKSPLILAGNGFMPNLESGKSESYLRFVQIGGGTVDVVIPWGKSGDFKDAEIYPSTFRWQDYDLQAIGR